ncbi:hypothetical protein OG884_33265 [Streptosporangium sp. NBC_01755]|uniref:hypothetical protein n=1 Tax=unclassified Streptosporangium TaxID=2632669 RepID=UPI002DDA5703|nr:MULTISPECIES: hypothetical protein [unclassified Streptosporangium]WSA28922.1 hypothetical protein OIE13_14215 [Streptosporangium sp. NBC_01810]WSC99631.1 hypothetical protein OG884_33265 [Streptosporangium sp. NBC_01755]
MDFTLPESALAVQRGVGDICARYDLDYWQRCESEKRWPEEVWQDLAKGGWLFDRQLPCGTEANIAKLTASQAA